VSRDFILNLKVNYGVARSLLHRANFSDFPIYNNCCVLWMFC